MNWDHIQGNWKIRAGKAREKSGKLTDKALTESAGRRESLAGLLQQWCGPAKAEADRAIDDFSSELKNWAHQSERVAIFHTGEPDGAVVRGGWGALGGACSCGLLDLSTRQCLPQWKAGRFLFTVHGTLGEVVSASGLRTRSPVSPSHENTSVVGDTSEFVGTQGPPFSFAGKHVMLWTTFLVLLVLWALGLASGATLNGFIHILLVVAVVVVLIRIIQGRRPI
jgi:uncharacterized protein YjbJ (UPF0337 family)